MFYNNTTLQHKYHNLVSNTEHFDKRMKILKVDFTQPWWDIITQQKGLAFLITSLQFVNSIFDALFPILIAWSITSASVFSFVLIALTRLGLTIAFNLVWGYNAIFQLQTIHSVEYAANKYFLEVDPIFHTTKSSGEILSKVQRGSDSYEDVMDIITFELFPMAIGFVTTVLAMFVFDWRLGFTSMFFIVLITLINIFGNIFSTKTFEPKSNKARDKLKAVIVENLQQAHFIRSLFATPEQLEKMKKLGIKNMVATANSWRGSNNIGSIVRMIYISSIIFIGLIVLNQLNSGALNSATALAIVLTYTNSTQGVLYIGDKVKRFSKSLVSITDLFQLINTFGKKSYPVLEEEARFNFNKNIKS